MSMIIFINSRPQLTIFLLIALHRILANSEPRRYKNQVFFYSKIGKTLDFLVDSTWDGDISGNSLEGGHIWVPWVCGLLLWSLVFGVSIIYLLYVSSRRLTKLRVSFWESIPKEKYNTICPLNQVWIRTKSSYIRYQSHMKI